MSKTMMLDGEEVSKPNWVMIVEGRLVGVWEADEEFIKYDESHDLGPASQLEFYVSQGVEEREGNNIP